MDSLPFAERVLEAMSARGLGLRELCRQAELDPSFLSKVLAGKRSPPWDEAVIRRVAGVLAVDAAELIISAGRIPAEWGRLWKDPELFERMNLLATGRAAAPVRRESRPAVRPVASETPRVELKPSRKDLSEELL